MALTEWVDAAVSAGRRAAEALMRDECLITRATASTFNPVTGREEPGEPADVYSGLCRVQIPGRTAVEPVAGEHQWTVQAAVVSIPISVYSVEPGDVVEVLWCDRDEQLIGRLFRVVAVPAKSDATSRRLDCEVVTK